MNLDSALELRDELLTGWQESTDVALALAGEVGIPKKRGRKGPPLPAGVALGVALTEKRNDVRLAVRVSELTTATRSFVTYVAGAARNEVDVREVGRIFVAPPLSTAAKGMRDCIRPYAPPGASVGHVAITAGTLGGYVKDANGRAGILSNNHVLANSNAAKKGDAILQQGKFDGGKAPDQIYASLQRMIRISPNNLNTVDAAYALLPEGTAESKLPREYNGRRIKRMPLPAEQIHDDIQVFKVGRTTGLTHGRISAFAFRQIKVDFDKFVCTFDDVIEVEGNSGAFSQGGDSGSFILTEDAKAVGLLFAGSDKGGSKGAGLTYANVMETVLQELELTLL